MAGFSYEVSGSEVRTRTRASVEAAASRIADQLMLESTSLATFATVSGVTLPRLDYDDALYLDDLRASLHSFERQARILDDLDLPFPCVETVDGAPLPIELPAGGGGHFAHGLRELPPGDREIGLYRSDQARGFVRKHLQDFLVARLTAAQPGTSGASEPGFPFRVETPDRSGLRIHYSGVSFLKSTNVFGNELSTPVESSLRGGRYVFGFFEPATSSVKWDLSAVYVVPGPVTVAKLL